MNDAWAVLLCDWGGLGDEKSRRHYAILFGDAFEMSHDKKL